MAELLDEIDAIRTVFIARQHSQPEISGRLAGLLAELMVRIHPDYAGIRAQRGID